MMKELSSLPLQKLQCLIHGQNYANIKARVDLYLPEKYATLFAPIHVANGMGTWYGNTDIDYHPYKEASDIEKEEISIWLEECKEAACATLASHMAYAPKLFSIPTENELFWYREPDGQMRVTLTQWGFVGRSAGESTGIISALLAAPRKHLQQDATIHIDYSDGKPADDAAFRLDIFNNVSQKRTDSNGDYHLGKILSNVLFAVENEGGGNRYEFKVTTDGIYTAVFDLFTRYTVQLENQQGTPLPNRICTIDGVATYTDENGRCEQEVKLMPDADLHVEVDGQNYVFELQRASSENVFTITLQEEIPLPPPPPEPVRMVKFRLLDHEGNPLSYLPFSIMAKNGKPIQARTDAEGNAYVEKTLFTPKTKYRIEFVLDEANADQTQPKKS